MCLDGKEVAGGHRKEVWTMEQRVRELEAQVQALQRQLTGRVAERQALVQTRCTLRDVQSEANCHMNDV